MIDSDEDTTVFSYELYELSNCSLLKNHVALVVVGKLVREIFDVALTSLLPDVNAILVADQFRLVAENTPL